MSDFKLDGITLDKLMEKTFCGKCNNSKDKEKDMIEGTKLKTFKEIYYSGGYK